MTITANRRTTMIMYSDARDIDSHRVRIVLAEKGVVVDICDVADKLHHRGLTDVNPYASVPTLVDRDLVLYEARVIMEYLDERFPHPPLMPVYPVARSKTRLMMYRVEQDWYSLMRIIEGGNEKRADKARGKLLESIISIAQIFDEKPYFLSDEFTLVDCCIAPLLWRLPSYSIKLPREARSVLTYAERLFERNSFQASLTELEREMRTK